MKDVTMRNLEYQMWEFESYAMRYGDPLKVLKQETAMTKTGGLF